MWVCIIIKKFIVTPRDGACEGLGDIIASIIIYVRSQSVQPEIIEIGLVISM